jgi:hypothetical protein
MPTRNSGANLKCQSSTIRDLSELIAALDRRVPQAQRAEEASIAHEAAALKIRALKRLEECEPTNTDEM